MVISTQHLMPNPQPEPTPQNSLSAVEAIPGL